jgi:hypothetical protein
METVTSLLWGAWEWMQTLKPISPAAERERARVRQLLE